MIHRIRSRSVFSRVRREGVHFRSGPLSCTMIQDESLSGPFVGYAIGRSVGTAVERNRVRRQLRELVKQRSDQFAAGVYVFGSSPRAVGCAFPILGHHLDRLLVQMASPEAHARPRKVHPR